MTSKAEGNKSGGDFPSTKSSGKLEIQQLERKKEESDGSNMPKALNLLCCAVALMVLYGYYILFGWAWLTAMTELGEDLNWAFFGLFVCVGGGMMGGVGYSMKHQQKGWWTPLSAAERKKGQDPRGKCCGFQIY